MNNGEVSAKWKEIQRRESRKNARYFRGVVHQRCKGKCEACGIFAPWILEIHHVRPVSAGGDGWPENLVGLCPNCHAVVEKVKTRMADVPYFSDWIWDHYGEGVYNRLLEIAYGEIEQ